MIQRYNSDCPIRDLVFQKPKFWVQGHDIPVCYMTMAVAESICEIIGEVQKSTKGVNDEGGCFMRVRVEVDVSLTLCCGRLIMLDNGTKHWVKFKYERLPNFCFWCGRLTHSDKNCELWIQSKSSLTPDQK